MTYKEMRKHAARMGAGAKTAATIGGNPGAAVQLAQKAADWEMAAEICGRLDQLCDTILVASGRGTEVSIRTEHLFPDEEGEEAQGG